MNNYHYIIASLPVISKGYEDKSLDLEKITAEIKEQCSESDVLSIDLFNKGFDGTALNEAFFDEVLKSKSRLTRLYYLLERNIRNMKVKAAAAKLYSAAEAEKKIEQYSILPKEDIYGDYRQPTDTEAELSHSDIQTLNSIFSDEDIMNKEKRLDDFKWEKINEFTTLDFFNIDAILAFLAKAHLTERWLHLDVNNGKHLFRKLVDEVRGTYDKTKLIYQIDENNG